MLSANISSFTSSSSLEIPYFFFLSNCMARPSNKMMSTSGNNNILISFLALGGEISSLS